jgi:protoheme IX farnesyltransferase
MIRFQKLAIATASTTVLLFGVGGLVRATGSGLGCTSWPKCGPDRWLPYPTLESWIEYTHRFVAFVVVVLIAWQAFEAWRRHRERRTILLLSVGAVPLVLMQAALGGIVVAADLDPSWVTVHFGFAMALVAVVVADAVESRYLLGDRARGASPAPPRSLVRLAGWTALVTFGALIVGTYVRATDSGLAFRDWPLMDGRLVPTLGGAATSMFLHRILAAASALLVLYLCIRTWSRPRNRALSAISAVALALMLAQVLVGAANVWSELRPAAVTAHVALSAAIWATLVALWVAARRESRDPSRGALEVDVRTNGKRTSLRETTAAYFQLTKPRIIVLLLVTTVPAMTLAERRVPSIWLVLATLAGGAIAAGSANAINCYLDRDIDLVMRRTRGRPLPAHRIEPENALAFGYVLGAISFLFLATTVNVLAASLALSAIAFYVFVYTMWLKRTSVQNIVIGGAAGAVPALVGWAAVTGTVGVPAWILFAIVFVWTPPHFWALAMRYSGDYAAAGIPMLPVVRGPEETRKQILLYSLVLFGTSLLLVPFGDMGAIYAGAAVALGGWFVWRALRLWRGSSPAESMRLFRFSIVYLGLLFAAVAVDAALPFAPLA